MASGFSKSGKDANIEQTPKQGPPGGNEQAGDAALPVTKILGQMALRRTSISMDKKDLPGGSARDPRDEVAIESATISEIHVHTL